MGANILDEKGQELLAAQEVNHIPASRIGGNVGLVVHPSGKNVRYKFRDVKVGGGRLEHHPERTFGPIAGTLYSVNGNTMKLAAQFMHLGEAVLPKPTMGKRQYHPRKTASLEMRPLGEETEWRKIDGPEVISPPGYHVLFRADDWDSLRDWETRVVYKNERGEEFNYTTIVKKDPVAKPVVSAAGLTGMGAMGRLATGLGANEVPGHIVVGRWTPANVWLPFAETVRAIGAQDVDVLFFTGDQIYENKPSDKDRQREPFKDYLYKWLLWHWSFRDLTNHIPAVCQPDDHDVYHGNLWGWSGRLNLTGFNGDGGYLCSSNFVNTVHLTQTGHNPDAYDPTPCENGISNYYGSFVYGGVGFAFLEDRKFKTPPKLETVDEQSLLGDRQEEFLKEWGEDWQGQKFKAVVSQSVYASMHVSFNGDLSMDKDSGGFPKQCRDSALRLFRRCGAFVLCGDQHLGTFSRMGVDSPSDAVYQMCVPAMGNIFWRWFYPVEQGGDRKDDDPGYLGEFTDLFGNYFRMVAVANPEREDLLSQKFRQRHRIPEEETQCGKGNTLRACQGDGYGIVRFNKRDATVAVECWPYNADPKSGEQFSGWPVTLRREDLDGRKPVAWLPDLKITGLNDPVVQIVDEETDEIIKIVRAKDGFYRPGVFSTDGTYTLCVEEPGTDIKPWKKSRLRPGTSPGSKVLKIRLRGK